MWRFHLGAQWHQQPLGWCASCASLRQWPPLHSFVEDPWQTAAVSGFRCWHLSRPLGCRTGLRQRTRVLVLWCCCGAEPAASWTPGETRSALDRRASSPAKHNLRWIRATSHCVRFYQKVCIRMCLHTGSLPMTCDSRFVRFWEENEALRLFRSRPCTAATTLPAATIDGGLAMKLTSDKTGT